MSETIRQQRTKTAREGAAALGVSERTVRRYMAQEREAYLAGAAEARAARLEAVSAMLEAGFSTREVADNLGLKIRAAQLLVKAAREETQR